MNVRLSPLATLLLLLAPLALADGGTVESDRYVLGSGNDGTEFCTGDTTLAPVDALAPAVGGDCGLPLHSSVATVRVVDDRYGEVGFDYVFLDATRHACGAKGEAGAALTLTLPASCVEARIFPAMGAASGVITVES